MSLVNMPSGFWRMLTSRFYEKGTRDDGLWHPLRGEATVYVANAQVIGAGGNWTTGDLRAVAGNLLPPHAKGVVFWTLTTSANVGADLFVAPGGIVAGPAFGKRVGRAVVANVYSLTSTCACLFGLTAGVPDGTLTFTAPGAQITFYAAVIGFIA